MGGRWFTVVGVLSPALLDPAVDAMALIGRPAAEKFFGSADVADKVYVRTKQDESNAVRPLLAASVNPPNPATVAISRPSEALAAQTVAKDTFTGLFIGLGLVALLVGGVGIANVMVISVLERRGEIGLRRALGAKRSHIAVQFLIEAFALSTLGGILGSMIGLLAVVCTAVLRGWAPVVPVAAVAVSVMASVVVGIVAGAYPARRASQLSPTEALRS
jgi:putative ABC transport system permease protein